MDLDAKGQKPECRPAVAFSQLNELIWLGIGPQLLATARRTGAFAVMPRY